MQDSAAAYASTYLNLRNGKLQPSSLYMPRNDTENTSHVIPSLRVYWRAHSCLATSRNIRPLRHILHCCTLERVYRVVA
jgi:hypothetical protein